MRKESLFTAALLFLGTLSAVAQERDHYTFLHTTKASANGNNSFMLFTSDTYNAAKKYVVFKFWHQSAPLSETEQKDLEELKELLGKKGFQVVVSEWKTEEDLKKLMKPFNMEISAPDGKHINLKSGSFSLNTTSSKAMYVLEDDKPISLCSGTDCEDKLKYFFKLKALN
jgi:heme-degrading monooxygenase HmoA